jgi:hypothetical protein
LIPDSVVKDTYSILKHRLDVHFPAKYKSVVPNTTAYSGVRTDEAPDLKKAKLNVGYLRSKIPITS